jgi:PAS domain S-box-containing protein
MTSENELLRNLYFEKDAVYAKILSRVSDALVALDKNWRYTFVNEQAAALFGRTPDDLVGKHIWTEFPEGIGQPFHLNYEKAMREQKPLCFEDYYAPWDRWFENRVFPSPDGISIFFHEITERKKAEEAISQYMNIVQNMQVGLYVYHLENLEDDHSLRLVAANPRSAGLLGLTEREIVGRTIDEIFPNLRTAGIPGKFAGVVRNGLPLNVEDFYYADTIINEACFSFKVFPLPDNCVGVLFEDITLRKNAETALQNLNTELELRVEQRTVELNDLNSELQAFNYSISHDLRAPLIRIKGYADILRDTCAAKLSTAELQYISRLRAASEQLDEHIEALLKLYQIDRGDFYIEPLNLSDLAVTIFNGLHADEPDRNVIFTAAGGVIVNADKVLMKEFMDNLISNAWKYTYGQGNAKIEFGVLNQDGRDVYFVRDNGVGFSMDYIDNIFTPFLRLHKEDKGLGIGLASVQRIIRLHGGKIWAESKEGEGATFFFAMQ